jgi:hypothetical protein
MNGSDWVAVAAIVVSAGVGMYVLWATSRQSRRLAGSGFKTVEDLKVDLVALLAALRSAIYKGIAADQSGEPQDVSHELERIRAFQTSPSGYALAALAAKRGSGSDPHAGRWRTLGLHFAELGGIVNSPPHVDRSVALTARHWSTEIETTLGSITLDDADWMAEKVGDLPTMIASLAQTREDDMVLGIWFKVAGNAAAESDLQK